MFCNEAVDCTTGEFLGKADRVVGVLWIHLAFIPRLFLFCWLDDWDLFPPDLEKEGVRMIPSSVEEIITALGVIAFWPVKH